MGIRVHKQIGFGARGFVAPEGFRDRLNEAYENVTLEHFADWCRAHKDEILAFAPTEDDKFRRTMLDVNLMCLADDKMLGESLGRYVEYDDEFGFEDGIVFIPPGWRISNWRRYNDDIDWSEETQLHGQQKRWVSLDREIEPFLKGKPPLVIAAFCLWLGIPEVFERLTEVLYVYWG
jgi:hypothetical protein